jgi:anhydro-N-acetylmuramic acid kinase
LRVAGLVSGQSADGIDAVLADIELSEVGRIEARSINSRWSPHTAPLRQRILQPSASTSEVACLHWELGACIADTAVSVLGGRGRGDLVGSHGQTVLHMPDKGVSLQLGEPAVIAERTGVPVVANFRYADLAAGGRGGPLVPFADWHLLSHERENRACLNLGAIASVTVLPAAGGLEDLTAFDIGPGNLMIDACGGDRGGAAALLGKVDKKLLAELLEHPFFARQAPKAVGWDDFGQPFIEAATSRGLARPDLMATLVALTAETVAQALAAHRVDRLLISGGGIYNRGLVRDLGKRFRGVLPTDAFGIGARAKEALAFAVLAFAAWHRIPAGLPAVTGARHPSVLGQICFAPLG